MTAATAFPEAWGFDQLINVNSSNIFNASVTALKEAGTGQIVSGLAFGIIPFLLAMMVYARYQKITPSIWVLLMCTFGLHAFELITYQFAVPIYILAVIGFGFSAYQWWNNNTQ